MYNYIINFIYFSGFFITTVTIVKLVNGYKYYKNINKNREINSFKLSDNEPKITILDIISNENIDENNLEKYLKHNILHTNDIFETVYFNNPITVKFKYLNNFYKICLKNLISTRDDHFEILINPLIIYASIENNGKLDVITEELTNYHGHTRNFYKHIPDVITDINTLLRIQNGSLRIINIRGEIKDIIL